MRSLHAIVIALVLCAATAAQAQNNSVFPSGGGGGGTPCTVTANSIQYDNAGSFGCVTQWTYNSVTGLVTGGDFQSGNVKITSDQIQDVANNFLVVSAGGDVAFSSNNGSKFAWGFRSGTLNFQSSSDAIHCWTGTVAGNGNTTGVDGTCDIGFARNAAGTLEVNNGTAATYRDVKMRNVYTATAGAAPTLTSCGTTPSIASGSTDMAGEVTMGAGSPTGCVITFNLGPYTNAPFCTVTWQSNLASMQYTISTTAITLTQTATSSNKVDYHCVQH